MYLIKSLPIFLLVIIFSCSESKLDIDTEEQFALLAEKYLVEYSPKTISVTEPIILKFKDEWAPDLSGPIEAGVKIYPEVEGAFEWISKGVLQFLPKSRLQYETKYRIQISLPELLQNKSIADNELIWSFTTRPLRYDLSLNGFKINLVGGEENRIVKGIVTSSDYVDDMTIEKIVRAAQAKNAALSIEWVHSAKALSHQFTIKGIEQRESENSTVKISWDGDKYDPSFKGQKEISVPASNLFELTEVILSDHPQRFIQVYFSRPLSLSQNLNGLISIDQHPEKLRTEIDGNMLLIYPTKVLHDKFTLYLSDKISSISNRFLAKEQLFDLRFDRADPAIRAVGAGMIVPTSSESIFSFEAINLKAVDIEIFKIFDGNVLQFLQENNLNEGYYMDQVGRIILQKTIEFSDVEMSINKWQRIGIDLKEYLSTDPGAIYQIRVGFQQQDGITDCDNISKRVVYRDGAESIMNYTNDYYYDYEGRDNPCNLSYYNPDRFIRRNILLSDIGAIVKKSLGNKYYFSLSKLSDGRPLSGATIRLYDYQQQLLAESFASNDGFAVISADQKASFAIIKDNTGFGYIKLDDQNTNSLTEFDVAGLRQPELIDGFAYTDRGVYRPGDTIVLNFMLDDSRQTLPDLHPVTLEVFDAKGTKRYERTVTHHVGHIYAFVIPTDANNMTGRWIANITVGAHVFTHNLRVEAIKPNRLKINLDSKEELKYYNKNDRSIDISSSWLHGAPAADLNVQVDAQMINVDPVFPEYKSYVFSDPARVGITDLTNLYKGKLDLNGEVHIDVNIDPIMLPGKVDAQLKTRVFEKGGNFSENYSKIKISPFASYTGVKSPENRWGYKSVQLGDDATFQLTAISDDGIKQSNHRLSVGVYNIEWEWWYYQGDRYNIYRLNSAEHKEAFYTTTVRTDINGNASLKVNFQDVEHGRKMIRVCDLESGHCTGDFFYATGYDMLQEESQRESLSKLSFTSDKASYEVGEQVNLVIPSEKGSRILVSIESGQDVILQEWINGKENSTEYQFQSSKSMLPNIYAHVTMIQSYDSKKNDLPIRMYGVIPIEIKDASTSLDPKITVANELKPNEKFDLKISESKGKPMAYTIAIVDEGLLDLTSFSTPDPHGYYYARQSLGVQTWDLYSLVLTGVSGEVDRMISIGGDGAGPESGGTKKAIRFKPVVMTAGPFYLAAGKTANHSFTMPNYMGSVRAMVVAKEGIAYGSADKAIPVRQAIMILPTAPRVISPGEEMSIPVSVFVSQAEVKNVKVKLSTSDNLKIVGKDIQTVNFDMPGEEIVYFKAIAGTQLGVGKLDVKAEGFGYTMNQSIEMDIRNPNPKSSELYQKVLNPGESWEVSMERQGMKGTNEGFVELSTITPINLENRLNYLIKYPYGCIEQTISSAMPQLYLNDIITLSEERNKKVGSNISSAIKRISKMQISNGGFAYWPGAAVVDEWATSYAGHFLIAAKERGYFIENSVVNNWVKYQKNSARTFQINRSEDAWSQSRQMINQAYRLYSLALFGQPELAAMNVLKLEENLPSVAQYMLAGAYAFAGKNQIAIDLVKNTPTKIEGYRELGFTYGSELRDISLIAQTMLKLDRTNDAAQLIKIIADKLNSSSWYGTQSVAQAFVAVGEFLKGSKPDKLRATMRIADASSRTVQYEKPVFLYEFDPDDQSDLTATITNTSTGILFANITLTGQKDPISTLDNEAVNRNLTMSVKYSDLNGNVINPDILERGTDFIAEVIIKNPKSRGLSLKQMALTQIFPSGWEIQSGGLSNVSDAIREDAYDYRDVRDDRVYTFFDINDTKTYRILLTAAYDGEYFLPPVSCEAMYDADIQSRTKARKLKVVAPGRSDQ